MTLTAGAFHGERPHTGDAMQTIKIKMVRPTVVTDSDGVTMPRDVDALLEVEEKHGAFLVGTGKAVLTLAPEPASHDLDTTTDRAIDTTKPPVSRRAKGS